MGNGRSRGRKLLKIILLLNIFTTPLKRGWMRYPFSISHSACLEAKEFNSLRLFQLMENDLIQQFEEVTFKPLRLNSPNHVRINNMSNDSAVEIADLDVDNSRSSLTLQTLESTIASIKSSSGFSDSNGLLSKNETDMCRDLLEQAIRSKYCESAVEIASLLLASDALTPYEFNDLLTSVSEECSYIDGLALLDKAASCGMELIVASFQPVLKVVGNAANARKLFQRMEFFGFSPNVISFTTAIKSCEISGDWRGALEIFSLMRATGVSPNERTYACMISAASRGLAADVALNALNEMTLNDFPPNIICYGAALTACARCGMWNEVDSILTNMHQQQKHLNQSMLSSVINVCRLPPLQPTSNPSHHFSQRAQVASASSSQPTDTDLASAKYSYPITQFSYNDEPTLDVDALTQGPVQSDRALMLFEKWVDKIDSRNESLFTLVMGICEADRRFNDVMRVYRTMRKFNISASRNVCRFALRSCIAGSNCEDATAIAIDALEFEVARPYMLGEVLDLCERMGRFDCAIKLLSHMLPRKFYGVSTKQMRSFLSNSLFLVSCGESFHDSESEDLSYSWYKSAKGSAPDTQQLALLLETIFTQNLTNFYPMDHQFTAARLLLNSNISRDGSISSLRKLLRDTVSPCYVPASLFTVRSSSAAVNRPQRLQIYVDVMMLLLNSSQPLLIQTNSSYDTDDVSRYGFIRSPLTSFSGFVPVDNSSQLIPTRVDKDHQEYNAHIILTLMSDLCSMGHGKKVVEMLGRWVLWYLQDYLSVLAGITSSEGSVTTGVFSSENKSTSSTSPLKQKILSGLLVQQKLNANKSAHSSSLSSSSLYSTSTSNSSSNQEELFTERKHIPSYISAAMLSSQYASSQSRSNRRKLPITPIISATDRARAVTVHHIITAVRQVIRSFSNPVPVPNKLYKIAVTVYRDADMPELLSAVFSQASEDGVVDVPLRDLMVASLIVANKNIKKGAGSSTSSTSFQTSSSRENDSPGSPLTGTDFRNRYPGKKNSKRKN